MEQFHTEKSARSRNLLADFLIPAGAHGIYGIQVHNSEFILYPGIDRQASTLQHTWFMPRKERKPAPASSYSAGRVDVHFSMKISSTQLKIVFCFKEGNPRKTDGTFEDRDVHQIPY